MWVWQTIWTYLFFRWQSVDIYHFLHLIFTCPFYTFRFHTMTSRLQFHTLMWFTFAFHIVTLLTLSFHTLTFILPCHTQICIVCLSIWSIYSSRQIVTTCTYIHIYLWHSASIFAPEWGRLFHGFLKHLIFHYIWAGQ